MLLGLDPLLGGDLLKTLRDMGHGDSICVVDCNFPAHEIARRAGVPCHAVATDTPSAARAILSVMPLDSFVEAPVRRMEVTATPDELHEAHRELLATVHGVAGDRWRMGSIERFAFYAEAAKCAAVVATLDRRGYACFILTKGVIGPDGKIV
ncbi:MAG: RbsD/FucU domain-containing protein [Geminicoccaceae bacterium]